MRYEVVVKLIEELTGSFIKVVYIDRILGYSLDPAIGHL